MFTDRFVRRPVLSLVVSAFVLLAGSRALLGLPVQQYPTTVSATITITTTYYGADAATVAGFITTPIENAVAAADGIDYMTGVSQTGQSTVTLYLRLNQSPNGTLAEVQAYVSGIANALPPGTQQPAIVVANTAPDAVDFEVASNTLTPEQVGDWVNRYLLPQLEAVPGVQNASQGGAPTLALRVWFDPDRLAQFGMTATEAVAALSANDYVTGIGTTLGGMTFANLAINSGLHDADAFRALVIRRSGSALIRLGDVATVSLGPDNTSFELNDNLGPGTFIETHLTPGANLIATAHAIRVVFDRVAGRLPPGIRASVAFDAATSVNAARHEVVVALVEAAAIVAAVIFLFLGSWRALVVPLVTIPLSLIGTLALMAVAHFSINLLTLLAFVLAIGLVVDDAIIVVENVTRHLRAGMRANAAAIVAARELAGPIVAMTVVLVAAYLPVGLQSGLTGALFTEFAFTLAGSVTVSALLAFTLTPMMCAHVLVPSGAALPRPSALARAAEAVLGFLQRVYRAILVRVLDRWPLVIAAAACILLSIGWMFSHAPHELAPQEDQDFMLINGAPPPSASLDQVTLWDPLIIEAMKRIPELRAWWINDQVGAGASVTDGVVLQPYGVRHRTANVVQAQLQAALNRVAGLELAAFQPPSLPGASNGTPVQFVLEGTGSIEALDAVSTRMVAEARRSGLFAYIDKDLKIDQPQITLVLDRKRLGELGLTVQSIGDQLNWLLGGSYVNYFSAQQRSYKVMPLVVRSHRLNASQILDYPIATVNNIPIPLGAVAHLAHAVVPEQINHFQQLLATTLSAVPAPGVTIGAAYGYLNELARRDLPAGYATDAAGQLREYVDEQGAFLPSFAFAMVIIFLALAALFGSFRDPVVIMVSVPMSIAGALFFVWLGVGGASVNLYSEIGLVTLAGLISKHGILIVEVANEQQALGLTKREAIERATMLRLRPILMTTAAMVLGVLPLLFATGSGAASRFVMGLVIASGLSVGTVFTLFVVPTVYLVVGSRHAKPAGDLTPPDGALNRGAPPRPVRLEAQDTALSRR